MTVEVLYSIADVTKMTRKKKNPHVLTLYFQKTITVLCAFEDPTECTKALKKKCYDMKMYTAAAGATSATGKQRPGKLPVLENLAQTGDASPPPR